MEDVLGYDTETTGLKAGSHGLVQVAGIIDFDGEVVEDVIQIAHGQDVGRSDVHHDILRGIEVEAAPEPAQRPRSGAVSVVRAILIAMGLLTASPITGMPFGQQVLVPGGKLLGVRSTGRGRLPPDRGLTSSKGSIGGRTGGAKK